MIPTGLLKPHSESEYLRLEQMYFELGNFIRSLWVHTEGEDKENYEIIKREMKVLSDRINEKMIIMDAFEQNELRQFKPTLPIALPKKDVKAPLNGDMTPRTATPDELSKGLERESWLK